ncbi:MAG: Signal recognition particle receptor FtsY [Capsulimonas sp.]|nr:Signal recognition particle receptor FtsY [Capsulimonas sp.]
MFKRGLFKTLFQKVDQLVTGRGRIDEELFEDLEEALIGSDLNIHTTMRVMEDLRGAVRDERLKDGQDVKDRLKTFLTQALVSGEGASPLAISPQAPTVYLVVGVNGVGKTTTIAKLAYKLKREGHHVIVAAADTFRAAAVDQLALWGERIGVDVVKGREGADPSAVVFDAMQAAVSRKADFLIIDTAGRLHNKVNLMEELKKINRIVMRDRNNRPADETLLVLDATTGQNAVNQAKEFKAAVNITGLVLAKLDGTARGGIVITIKDELGVPIKLVGIGEKPEDLEVFDPAAFVDALFEE